MGPGHGDRTALDLSRGWPLRMVWQIPNTANPSVTDATLISKASGKIVQNGWQPLDALFKCVRLVVVLTRHERALNPGSLTHQSRQASLPEMVLLGNLLIPRSRAPGRLGHGSPAEKTLLLSEAVCASLPVLAFFLGLLAFC